MTVRSNRVRARRRTARVHGAPRHARAGVRTRTRPAGVRRARYKRPFDLAVLAILGVALSPLWLTLAVAIPAAIRLHDGGPALYRQRRLGCGGRTFRMLKFRTMAVDAERDTGPVWAGRRDRRITAPGRVLRRFHLDELPQALNVARGQMSLVGPRPERPILAARIERAHPGFADRLAVPPGIAGLAQAHGRVPARALEKLRYDRVYIGAMGPWLDLKLLGACVWRALAGRRAPRRKALRQALPQRLSRLPAPRLREPRQ